MNAFDSSILVAALFESEFHHEACKTLVISSNFGVWSHSFVETFNTLTSGKIKPRPSAANVAKALRSSIRPRTTILQLPEEKMLSAFDEAEKRGVRGGAIFDYLHLVTARLSDQDNCRMSVIWDPEALRSPLSNDSVIPPLRTAAQ